MASTPLDTPERRKRAAVAFIGLGWHVNLIGPTRLPLKNCEMCDPKGADYLPHSGTVDCPHGPDVCHGWQSGSNDASHVLHLLDRHPEANLGISNGLSGLVTVDLDTNKRGVPVPEKYSGLEGLVDGLDVFDYLLNRYNARWPEDALWVTTPSGGIHLTWRLKPGTVVNSSSNGRFGWLVDIRAAGSYTPAPGTVVRGGQYRRCGDVTNPAEAPAWLMHHLKATGHTPEPPRPRRPRRREPREGRERAGQERLGRIADQLVTAPEHTGHAALCTATIAAAHLVADGLIDENDARDTIFEAGRDRNRTESEIRDAWRTALAKAGAGFHR